MTQILLGYVAGLLTLLNPCVLPVLPIILASSLQADRRGPLALAAGLSLSFVVAGMLVLVVGASVGIDQRMMTTAGAVLMLTFGTVLMVPGLGDRFASVTAGMAGRANSRMLDMENTGRMTGLSGQFVGGLLLGFVWSPCIGPTLGGAISLASQGQNLLQSTIIMTTFALGVSTIILLLGFGAREALSRRKSAMNLFAGKAKTILGITFICVGVAILSGFDHWLEGQLLDILPVWLQDFSVSV